jgi:hypothetical protein
MKFGRDPRVSAGQYSQGNDQIDEVGA